MFYRAGLPACIALLLLSSCARQPAASPTATAVERIAILRFENFGADPGQDWMGRAFSEVITQQLTGAPAVYAMSTARLQGAGQALGARPAGAPGISTSRAAALAAGANRLGYGEYSTDSDRLTARLTLEDPASGKILRALDVETAATEVIPAAISLAASIRGKGAGKSGAAAYLTSNIHALRSYALALESANAAALLDESIAADPNFTPAYRMLAEIKARQDRAGAIALLEKAQSGAVDPAEKALIEGQLAGLRGDPAMRARATSELARLNPLDPTVWRTLGEVAMTQRDYSKAAEAYAKSVAIEPEDFSGWNQYGYAAGYAGDMEAAVKALGRYQALRPADANPLDSQGDINLINGRLREAESFYLAAAKKDPNFANGAPYFKAALAHLMTGDVAGADTLAKQWTAPREANDPLAEFRAIEWDWAAGRRKAAYQRLASAARIAEAGPSKDLAANAYSHLSIWSLMLGDRQAAAAMAAKSASLATSTSALSSYIARFLTQPAASANAWSGRAERLFPNPQARPIRDLTLSYSLLFANEFAAASPLLKNLLSGNPSIAETNLPILLAWSLLRSDNLKDSAALLRWNPIPPVTGPGAFFSLYFPRVFYLKALAAEKEGRSAEAKNNYQLFLQLSGADPLMWGEEAKARAALNHAGAE